MTNLLSKESQANPMELGYETGMIGGFLLNENGLPNRNENCPLYMIVDENQGKCMKNNYHPKGFCTNYETCPIFIKYRTEVIK